jgi:membrane associated rhomboid family serine protease
MRPAPVGFQCPSCVNEGAKSMRQGRTPFGGVRTADSTLTSRILIGLNVLVWLLITATGGSRSEWLYKLWLLPKTVCVDQLNFGPCRQIAEGVAGGAWWQPLTAMFTHVQIWHIGFNMLALWVLGPQLEMVMGRVRFLALYLLSGLAGSAFVYWLSPVNGPTVGASGAIFGLMGALLVVAIKVRGDVQGILFWVGLNFFITVMGRGFISWQGHLGGFVGGILLGLLIAYAPRAKRGTLQTAGMITFAIALGAAFAVRTAMLV